MVYCFYCANEVKRVDVLGFPTQVEVWGTGPKLLFIHGWGARTSLYRPLLDHLAQRYTVAAFDMPGVGDTPEPDRPWTLADYLAFVRDILRQLDWQEVTLVGHSHGGRVIVGLLADKELQLICRKAVILAGACLRNKRGLRYYAKVYSFKAGKLLLKPFPKLLERYRQRRGSADYKAASPIMRGTLSNLVAVDQRKLLPTINTSILLIWGDKDDAAPLWIGQTMEKLLPDAGLVVLPNGGHFAVLEQWNRVAPVLDVFLNGR